MVRQIILDLYFDWSSTSLSYTPIHACYFNDQYYIILKWSNLSLIVNALLTTGSCNTDLTLCTISAWSTTTWSCHWPLRHTTSRAHTIANIPWPACTCASIKPFNMYLECMIKHMDLLCLPQCYAKQSWLYREMETNDSKSYARVSALQLFSFATKDAFTSHWSDSPVSIHISNNWSI